MEDLFMEETIEDGMEESELEEDTWEEITEEEIVLDLDMEEVEVPKKIIELAKGYKREEKLIYLVTSSIYIDDSTEKDVFYLFGKPNTKSYDRYVKTMATSNSKALTTFVLDNIIPEQRAELNVMLKKYPALAISLGEKLLAMLGLAKTMSVKKL